MHNRASHGAADFGLMRLGAQQHPVDRLGVRRLGQRIELDLDGATRSVECQPLEGLTHAGDDLVPTGRRKAAGRDAANTAKPDHGDAQTLICRRRHAAMVGQSA